MLQEYNIQDGESVFDVVLKLYGSLELYGKYMQDNIENFSTSYYQSSTYYSGIVVAANIIALDGDLSETLATGASIFISPIQQTVSILRSYYTGFPPGETIVILAINSLTIDESVSVTPTYNSEAILTLGTTALYDPSLYVSSPAELTQSSVIPSTIQTLLGQEGQSVYDLCLMTYGDISQIYQLLQDSGINSINETDLSQQLFTYDTSLISDNTFYNYLSAEGIIINTGEGSLAGYNYLEQQNFYNLLQENGFRLITL